MTTLVTGGLGYIGSHIVRLLENRGERVVVIDDYSTGVAARVTGSPIVRLDLASDHAPADVAGVIREHDVQAVIHLAARKRVDESVTRPLWYYSQNVKSVLNVLTAMTQLGTGQFVFSSSAAVYGSSLLPVVDESAPLAPINPYGATKLAGEMMAAAAANAHGIRVASLRYFNVAGAGWPDLGDVAAQNVLPIVVDRIDAGLRPQIYGEDYDTPDGTCVRDYIHVLDIAHAHIAAIEYLRAPSSSSNIALNVGTGSGTSVLQLVTAVLDLMGSQLTPEILARRPGDPASVVAAVVRIGETLNWRARYGLEDMVRSTLEARGFS